jgi:hypothetical protein
MKIFFKLFQFFSFSHVRESWHTNYDYNMTFCITQRSNLKYFICVQSIYDGQKFANNSFQVKLVIIIVIQGLKVFLVKNSSFIIHSHNFPTKLGRNCSYKAVAKFIVTDWGK